MDPRGPLQPERAMREPIENGKKTAPGAGAPVEMPGEERHRGLLQILWDRRWMVVLGLALCLGGGFAYLAQATPKFTSASRIYVEQTGPKIISEYEGVMTRSKNYLYTQAELLKATPILSEALQRPGMTGLQTFEFDRVDNRIAYLKKRLHVEVGKKDDLITVSFEGPYPKEAAQLVNAVVDAYVTYQAQQKQSTAAEVLKILQSEKAKRDKELQERLKEMMAFKKEHPWITFETEKGGNIIVTRLSRLSDALTQAQLRTLETKAAYEVIKAADPEKVKNLVQAQRGSGGWAFINQEQSRLRAERDELQRQLARLKRECTDRTPAVLALLQEIEDLDTRIASVERDFAEAQVAAAYQRWQQARAQEEELRALLDKQREMAEAFTSDQATFRILESGWERTKKLCDILDERIKELNVTEDTGALNIRILEVAKPAKKPSSPQRTRTMAIALVLGLMLGGGLAFVRDWTDQRFRSTEDISAVLGTPVLGVVPTMAGLNGQVTSTGLALLHNPRSHAAEAYRTIRTAIYFGVPDGAARSVVVTSPEAGEGKSTLVANLAVAMAQAGQRTLILDADFHKPVQHKIFEVDREKGLSAVLAGRCDLEGAIQPTGVEGLEVVPSGPHPPNPSELLNSQAFADLLERLSERYEHVLVDSPPILALTDAWILGAMCEVTVLILKAEKSHRKAAIQSCEALRSVGAHLLGVVVNQVPRRKHRYYYYGGYRYYRYRYGYGYSGTEKERHGEPADVAKEQ